MELVALKFDLGLLPSEAVAVVSAVSLPSCTPFGRVQADPLTPPVYTARRGMRPAKVHTHVRLAARVWPPQRLVLRAAGGPRAAARDQAALSPPVVTAHVQPTITPSALSYRKMVNDKYLDNPRSFYGMK